MPLRSLPRIVILAGIGLLIAGSLDLTLAQSATRPMFTPALPASSMRPLPEVPAGSLSPPTDRWWARDKAKHVAFSFLWTLSVQYVLVNKAEWSESDALPASVGVTVTIGLSKELYDWRAGPTRHFSGKDLIANGVGILAAVGVILL